MTDSNTNDGFAPTEATRPANIEAEIDRMLISGRVNTETGEVEELNTGRNQRATAGGDHDNNIPSAQQFVDEMSAHAARAQAIQARLAAQVYDRDTGKPTGPKVTGAERERLEGQLKLIGLEMQHTDERARRLLPLRAQQEASRASATTAEATNGLAAAAQRADAIEELAHTVVNGKPLGYVEAARRYDEAAARTLADKLARR